MNHFHISVFDFQFQTIVVWEDSWYDFNLISFIKNCFVTHFSWMPIIRILFSFFFSCLCATPGSDLSLFLALCSGIICGVELNLGEPCANWVPSLLYYHTGPLNCFLYPTILCYSIHFFSYLLLPFSFFTQRYLYLILKLTTFFPQLLLVCCKDIPLCFYSTYHILQFCLSDCSFFIPTIILSCTLFTIVPLVPWAP